LKELFKFMIPRRWRQQLRVLQWRIEKIWDPSRGIQGLGLYAKFRQDLRNYRALPEAERINPVDIWPCLFDKTGSSPIPAHYFYQAAWAARRILQTNPREHFDIGSQLDLIGIFSALVPIVFVDIRPLVVPLSNVRSVAGSILELPFKDHSVSSLSCLHVIEHIGLGRYGDELNPRGTKEASVELNRVMAAGGNLFISTPVGRERLCFNAHRIHSPQTILDYFEGFDLMEFSCEDDSGRFREKVDPAEVNGSSYTCGLFWLKKKR
jgi:hypothetical protein